MDNASTGSDALNTGRGQTPESRARLFKETEELIALDYMGDADQIAEAAHEIAPLKENRLEEFVAAERHPSNSVLQEIWDDFHARETPLRVASLMAQADRATQESKD